VEPLAWGGPPGQAPGAGAAADAGLDEWQRSMPAEAEGWVTGPPYWGRVQLQELAIR